jgi:replicative DNA helicase
MIYRVTPHDETLEKYIIGQAMISPASLDEVLATAKDDDFWDPKSSAVIGVLRASKLKGVSLDVLGLVNALNGLLGMNKEYWEGYARSIIDEVVSEANLTVHLGALLDLSIKRKLIRVLGDSLDAVYNSKEDTKELINKTESAVLAVRDNYQTSGGLKSMSEVLSYAAKGWQEIAEGVDLGVKTGIRGVDDILKGLRPGKHYVLAARPGLGKSMLALQFASQSGVPVAHYSLEMLANEQVERMISQECDLNSESLQSRNVLLSKGPLLKEVTTKLLKLPIQFCDTSPITPMDILGQCRRMKKKDGLGLIIVDYLQLISGVGKFERRDLEVGFISKFLKRISMELNVPVLSIASLSRRPEERQDKRPMLSDLRESGSLESDADCVMFLYRESDYNKSISENYPNATEFIVSKNRGGQKGCAVLNFDGAHSKFYDMEQDGIRNYLNTVKGGNDGSGNTGNTKKVQHTSGAQW